MVFPQKPAVGVALAAVALASFAVVAVRALSAAAVTPPALPAPSAPPKVVPPDVRDAGPDAMADPPEAWDAVDEQGDESFPASDPPGNY